MAKREMYKAQQFIDAIPGSGGILSTIAARVGCHRNTVQEYIDKYVTVKAAYESERRKIDDKAQSNILAAINEGDIALSKWWLSVKMPDEFAPTMKNEHTGKDGDPLEIVFRYVNADANHND
jgi:hypothetical protein